MLHYMLHCIAQYPNKVRRITQRVVLWVVRWVVRWAVRCVARCVARCATHYVDMSAADMLRPHCAPTTHIHIYIRRATLRPSTVTSTRFRSRATPCAAASSPRATRRNHASRRATFMHACRLVPSRACARACARGACRIHTHIRVIRAASGHTYASQKSELPHTYRLYNPYVYTQKASCLKLDETDYVAEGRDLLAEIAALR